MPAYTISPDTFEYPGAADRAAQSRAEALAWLDSFQFNAAQAFAPAATVRPTAATWSSVEETAFCASWYAQ